MVGISKRFGTLQANNRIDLTVRPQTVHLLVGENGAGKSTLMRILAGLCPPDAGEVQILGQPLRRASASLAIQLGLGMVHQHFMLVEPLTVAENLVLGREPRRRGLFDMAAARRAVEELGATFGLPLDPRAIVGDLPVGQRQKVEILKALYRGAEVLVLDEPTAVLTPPETRRLFAMLRRFRDQGRTVLLITHKLDEVMAVADTVTVLRGGEKIADLDAAQTSPPALARLMVGREVRLDRGAAAPVVVPPQPVPALELCGVSLRGRGEADGLHEVSLRVEPGEIVGVAGVQGNGQRELLEVIAGLRRPDQGRILLAGQPLERLSARQRLAAGLSHIPEDRQEQGLVLDLTVAENLILGRQRGFRRLLGLDRRRIARRAAELIAEFDIRPPQGAVLARTLSGGNQQKVVVARELAGGRPPRVLLAGQPTRGVDVGAVEEIHQRLRTARDGGAAVLLISADLNEILLLADRILVLYGGRIVSSLPAGEASLERLGELMLGAAGESR
jgi:simple sugar transport system ATP-binding protein